MENEEIRYFLRNTEEAFLRMTRKVRRVLFF